VEEEGGVSNGLTLGQERPEARQSQDSRMMFTQMGTPVGRVAFSHGTSELRRAHFTIAHPRRQYRDPICCGYQRNNP